MENEPPGGVKGSYERALAPRGAERVSHRALDARPARDRHLLDPESAVSHESVPAWPDRYPELLPYLPLVHSAWADGILTPDEVRALRRHLDDQTWLAPAAREALGPWLDAERPPEAEALATLRARMRRVCPASPDDCPPSLADVGLALARAEARDAPWRAGAVAGLRALEADLGVVGREAATHALGLRLAGPEPEPPPFDAAELNAFLDADHHELRREILALLAEPGLHIPPDTPHDAYRERVLEAVRLLAERGYGALGYPEAYGGRDDAGAALAVFETLAFGDLSVLVKFGVQFGLFGGSVLQLGTGRHHRAYLSRIATLELPGCFAMTETGHGSNVRDLETTATYDARTDELVVDTPREEAGKDWIGNAARHGRLATVFARLVVEGEDHGVHAVLVPIRDEVGEPLPGVRVDDRGLKEGLNGVDNGRLWFDGVRVPRDNLLDRFAHIDGEGRYHSPIPGTGRRFFTTIGTLVAGRISIAAASVSAAKTGLAIANRYGDGRRQFGPEGAPEVPILDYLAHQRLLLPRLATTYALHFALRDLQDRYASAPDGGEIDREIEVVAAGLKAYASRHCVETLQTCREACGGQGYLAANRFGRLKADTDVFTTFEGANPVLLQLVAKGLLTRYRDEMGDLRLWGVVRYLAERAQAAAVELNPVQIRRTDAVHLTDPAFHRAALSYREDRLLRSAAARLKRLIDAGEDSFDALNACQDHLIALAEAHVERRLLEAFHGALGRTPPSGPAGALETLSALYALSRIEAHRAWYLEAGYLEAPKSRAVRTRVNELCGEIRRAAVPLVDAFGIPDRVLRAPAAVPSDPTAAGVTVPAD